MKKLLHPFYTALVLVIFISTASAQTNTREEKADFAGREINSQLIFADSCITLQPDSAQGKDAILHSGLPNMNTQPHVDFGAAAWTCGGTPCNDRGLIEFDFSSIPVSAIVNDARLNLYATLNPTITPVATSGTSNTCYLQRVTSPWMENTVTWNSQPITTNINEVILPQSTSTLQDYLNVDVTNLVQDMIVNTNYGFMIKLVNETYYNCMVFNSSDSPDLIRHPSITVCYTVPTGINVNAANKDAVSIFPNPFKEDLFLNPMKLTSENIQVTVYDIAGRVVFILNSNGGIINLSQNTVALNSGIYFIETKNSTTSFINKIVKL